MTDRQGPLPTFVVIGAMKAGTSALRRYLQGHPDVYLAPEPELDFFIDRNWERGEAWYRAHFGGADGQRAVGEKSPVYTMEPEHPHVPERMAQLIPDARLVYVVREPISRIRSHWIHNRARANEMRSLARAVREDPRYADTSRYALQLDRYLEHFARDQMLVLTADQLRDDPAGAVAAVAVHIGVDPEVEVGDIGGDVHRSADKRLPGRGLARLKKLPGFQSVIDRLPAGVRSVARRAATTSATDADPVNDETRAWLLDRLADDTNQLRDWLDEGIVDAWLAG